MDSNQQHPHLLIFIIVVSRLPPSRYPKLQCSYLTLLMLPHPCRHHHHACPQQQPSDSHHLLPIIVFRGHGLVLPSPCSTALVPPIQLSSPTRNPRYCDDWAQVNALVVDNSGTSSLPISSMEETTGDSFSFNYFTSFIILCLSKTN